MYHIGICDKEPAFLEHAVKLVSEILQSRQIPFHIHTFTSGQQLHPYLSQNRFYPPPCPKS